MCNTGRSDSMSGPSSVWEGPYMERPGSPEPKMAFESVLIKDCAAIKEQLRSLNGTIGEIGGFLRPVSVDIPVAVVDEKQNASGTAPVSPVSRELKEIAEMIKDLQGRLYYVRDRIRT